MSIITITVTTITIIITIAREARASVYLSLTGRPLYQHRRQSAGMIPFTPLVPSLA